MPVHRRTETDGITAQTSVTLELGQQPLTADERRTLIRAVTRRVNASSFERQMAELEPHVLDVRHRSPVRARPRYASDAWYADQMLTTIACVRNAIRSSQRPGVAPTDARAWVDNALAAAIKIGYLAAEWNAKEWPVTRSGVRTRGTKRKAGLASGLIRRTRTVPLRDAVRAYRDKHPDHTRRTMAANLLAAHRGRATDRRTAIKNLAERIRKLDATKK